MFLPSCVDGKMPKVHRLYRRFDQVLSAIAVFCTHSLIKRVTVVMSPPLMESLGGAALVSLIGCSL